MHPPMVPHFCHFSLLVLLSSVLFFTRDFPNWTDKCNTDRCIWFCIMGFTLHNFASCYSWIIHNKTKYLCKYIQQKSHHIIYGFILQPDICVVQQMHYIVYPQHLCELLLLSTKLLGTKLLICSFGWQLVCHLYGICV